jgi:predicted transcriptional regulator
MSKAVLISIRPEWCEKIINGQKTIEIRKTRPKIETPFKCYIYCTEGKLNDDLWLRRKGCVDKICNGKVIGEFTCDRIIEGIKVEYKHGYYGFDSKMLSTMKASMLLPEQIYDYLKDKTGYGWHISDLLIYDKPKELNEFMKPCPIDHNCFDCCYHHPWFDENGKCEYKNISGNIRRPPQSWC